MIFLEIFAVVAAVLFLFGAGLATGRQALEFGRTVKRIAGETQPRVFGISNGATSAQARAFAVSERAGYFQRRLFVLRATVGKMIVLVSAFREAGKRLDPVRNYLGI